MEGIRMKVKKESEGRRRREGKFFLILTVTRNGEEKEGRRGKNCIFFSLLWKKF